MEKSRDVEDFWRQKEAELQEPVLYRSIGQWTRSTPRGVSEVFGLLYMSASRVVFEYSDKPRKSILEALLRGKDSGQLDESLIIRLAEIQWVRRVSSSRVRRWVRKGADAAQIGGEVEHHPSPEILSALTGTHLCIATPGEFYAFLTPNDREWEQKLQTAM